MKIWKSIFLAGLTIGMFNGCVITFEDQYEVDSSVDIPLDIRKLIYNSVEGYTMPSSTSEYSTDIYPANATYNSENLPYYVVGDFNGDGYDDYAYMFTDKYLTGGEYSITSKLLVVLYVPSTGDYNFEGEWKFGPVYSTTDDEYWGIRLLREDRTYSYTTVDANGNSKVNKVTFTDRDGIYLGSDDPDERTYYYVDNGEIIEVAKDLGAVAKKTAGSNHRAPRAYTDH